MIKFYKTCFFIYKVALIALIFFGFFGNSTINFVGEDGLDPASLVFIIDGGLLIALGIILQFTHLPVGIKHLLSYIATVLIFVTVLFTAFWMYDSISVADYTPIFAFLIIFTLLAGISFYAVITKKIAPIREKGEKA